MMVQKSQQKGLLKIIKSDGTYKLIDQVTWAEEKERRT